MALYSDPRDVLIQAIIAKWASVPALQSGISGPWQGERPADAQGNPAVGSLYPYCLIPPDESPLEIMTCAGEIYGHDIRFMVYATSPEACRAASDLIKPVYDSDTLSLTLDSGNELVSHRPTGGCRVTPLDKTVYQAEIPYYFQTRRARVA